MKKTYLWNCWAGPFTGDKPRIFTGETRIVAAMKFFREEWGHLRFEEGETGCVVSVAEKDSGSIPVFFRIYREGDSFRAEKV